jgi:hypothetical protein
MPIKTLVQTVSNNGIDLSQHGVNLSSGVIKKLAYRRAALDEKLEHTHEEQKESDELHFRR